MLDTARSAPQSVRYLNELRALDVLFRDGAMSRADLARTLGLNRSTTSSIINSLLAESLVIERDRDKSAEPRTQTGRPGIDVELNPQGALFVGAEIEVEQVTAVAIDLTGRLVKREAAVFPAGRLPPERSAEKVVEMVRSIVDFGREADKVRGVGIAVPALVEEGVARLGLLLNWRDVPLAQLVSDKLGVDVPIVVENDANAFAIAETYCGNSRNIGTVVFVVIESGAGGGVVSEGQLFRGGRGMAGEVGHLIVGGTGYAPDGRGLLESYVAKEAVLARYKKHSGSEVGLARFLELLEQREDAAVRTAQDWGRWLVRGLSHVVNLLNPDLIIIGGSVGRIFPFVAPQVCAALRATLSSEEQMPRIEMSEFGMEGPAFGAALLLHQRMFSVDEKAVFPKGDARGLMRVASA
jgi:predicted NBD/HSP70 family sugar kinase